MEFSNQFLKLNGLILIGKRPKLVHIKLYLREQKQYCCVYGQIGQKSCLWAKGKFHPNCSPKTAQSFKLLHIWNFKKSLFMSHSNTWLYCCVQNRPIRYLEISTGLIFCLENWYDDEVPQLDKILVHVILQKISFCHKISIGRFTQVLSRKWFNLYLGIYYYYCYCYYY